MNITIARIFKVNQSYNDKFQNEFESSDDLKIDNHNVVFLRSILLKTRDKLNFKQKIEKNGNEERRYWLLQFFNDSSSFKQNFHVEFFEVKNAENLGTNTNWESLSENKDKLNYPKYESLSKLAYIESNDDTLVENEVSMASLAVRNSKAIKKEHLSESSTNWFHVDGRGLMFIGKKSANKTRAHFERNVILMTLAYAYLESIEQINEKLANAIHFDEKEYLDSNNEKILREIYLLSAKFNARYMFSMPVLNSKTSLVIAWHAISEALKIEKLNHELNNQLDSIHYIIKIHDEKLANLVKEKENQKNELFNKRITYIGVVLSIIGLISVYKDIKELWMPFLP